MVLIIGAIIDRGIDATGCWSPAAKPAVAPGRPLSRIRSSAPVAANNAWWAAGRWLAGLVDDLGIVGLGHRRRHGEQLACPGEVGGAIAVGEQAVMADAVEAFGQDVAQEASNELVRRERQVLLPVAAFSPVVFPREGDTVVVAGDQAAV